VLKDRFSWLLKGLLFFQALLIVSGGAVRLTGSGLGCPTWPTCTGPSYTPVPHQAQGQLHAWIEFGNRLIAWFIFILAVISILTLIRNFKNRSDYRKLRLLLTFQLLGFLAQAILGGITVLTKLNPFAVSAHFLLSIPLVAGALTLVYLFNQNQEIVLDSITARISKLFLSSIILLIILGTVVTGSGPLSGDLQAKRYHLDEAKIARLHSYIAIASLIFLIGLIISVKRISGEVRVNKFLNSLWLMFGLLLLQGVIGYWQFNQGLPELLVGLHLVGVTLIWITAWHIHLQTRRAK